MKRAIRQAGAHLLFLSPYSPDPRQMAFGHFRENPIEMMFAKLKLVPSRNVIPSCTPCCWTSVSRRSQTWSRDQRVEVCAAIHHGPSSAGTARHLAPLSCRHTMALIVRRRC